MYLCAVYQNDYKYALSIGIINFSSGPHIPVKSDSILIHPLTMETCGIAIATPVLVETAHTEGTKVTENVAVCRAWPIASIPLDGKRMFSVVVV